MLLGNQLFTLPVPYTVNLGRDYVDILVDSQPGSQKKS